jgi:hypothetical protein
MAFRSIASKQQNNDSGEATGLGKNQQSVSIRPTDQEGDGETSGDRGKPNGE